jgi:hypothetical protein
MQRRAVLKLQIKLSTTAAVQWITAQQKRKSAAIAG